MFTDARSLLASAVVAVAIGASLVGCPGSLDDPDRFVDGGTSTGCTDATPILQKNCLGSGCHNATDKFSDLDLETPGVVGRYKGVKAKGGASLLVDPSTPSESAIAAKTKSPVPFGAQMPLGGTKLTAAEQACIVTWITKELATTPGTDSGAPADSGAGSDSGAATDAASD